MTSWLGGWNRLYARQTEITASFLFVWKDRERERRRSHVWSLIKTNAGVSVVRFDLGCSRLLLPNSCSFLSRGLPANQNNSHCVCFDRTWHLRACPLSLSRSSLAHSLLLCIYMSCCCYCCSPGISSSRGVGNSLGQSSKKQAGIRQLACFAVSLFCAVKHDCCYPTELLLL